MRTTYCNTAERNEKGDLNACKSYSNSYNRELKEAYSQTLAKNDQKMKWLVKWDESGRFVMKPEEYAAYGQTLKAERIRGRETFWVENLIWLISFSFSIFSGSGGYSIFYAAKIAGLLTRGLSLDRKCVVSSGETTWDGIGLHNHVE